MFFQKLFRLFIITCVFTTLNLSATESFGDSKKIKSEIAQKAIKRKPNVKRESKKINSQISRKALISKPTNNIAKVKVSTPKKEVSSSFNPVRTVTKTLGSATKTLLSILPKDSAQPEQDNTRKKVFEPKQTLKSKNFNKKRVEKPNSSGSKYTYKHGRVKSSLSNLISKLNIPNSVKAKTIKTLGSRHSLSSDLRKGDLFEILYQSVKGEDGKTQNYIIYVSLKGKIINSEAFSYSSTGDITKSNLYDKKGRSFSKSILRNPMKRKYRISSGFGYRKHPILKRRILHAGTDFAAKTGTPIYAAGDGTISKIGRFGGYGNYIKIKHDSKWQTSYGHMHKFAKGMRKWKRVKQGQLIGYVGSTGRSTGPHLHYEVLRHGKAVDSQKVSLPVGIQLNRNSVLKLKNRILEIRKILKNYK